MNNYATHLQTVQLKNAPTHTHTIKQKDRDRGNVPKRKTKPYCALLAPQPLIKPMNCPISSTWPLISDTVYII